MRVRWLRRALKALTSAHDLIAKDNPEAARRFFQHALASVEQLVHHPERGRAGRVPGTRELVLLNYPYVIPYRVKGGELQILHVFHTARAWPQTF